MSTKKQQAKGIRRKQAATRTVKLSISDAEYLDTQCEARFRAYLIEIPLYLGDPTYNSWIRWVCNNDDNESAVLIVLYCAFGVDKRGHYKTQPPDPQKGFSRRWLAMPDQVIKKEVGLLDVRKVKKGVEGLKRRGFIEHCLKQCDGHPMPHYHFNWDRLLATLIEYMDAHDPLMLIAREFERTQSSKESK